MTDARDGVPRDAVPAGDQPSPDNRPDKAVDDARRDVAEALAALADVEDRPAAEQVAAFHEAHETLHSTLSRIDEH